MDPLLDYLAALPDTLLLEALETPQYSAYANIFAAPLEVSQMSTEVARGVSVNLDDIQSYFEAFPPGQLNDPEMANFLDLRGVVTMEMLINSWLIYLQEEKLLTKTSFGLDTKTSFGLDTKTSFGLDDNLKHFFPNSRETLPLGFLANLLVSKLVLLDQLGDEQTFVRASRIRQRVKNLE